MSRTIEEATSFSYKDFVATIEGFDEHYKTDIDREHFFGFPLETILNIERSLLSRKEKSVAYFSMEFGIAPSIYNSFRQTRLMSEKNQFYTHEVFSNYWLCDYLFKVKTDKMLDIPIYGGGLGVLAGDAIKSSADIGCPVAGVGILWNKGYFKQNFWYKHGQVPEELTWDPSTYPGLVPLKNIVTIETKEGPVHLRLWKYYVYSYDQGHACPIILLDSNLERNHPSFRKLTDQLYRSDDVWWKIYQRLILGVGGVRALESLGYGIDRYHLNEGHAAFALAEKYIHLDKKDEFKKYQEQFAYTCHTPVAAGHDRFSIDDITRILNDDYVQAACALGKESEDSDQINLTYMCLNNCQKVNAVAVKHGEITRLQFPNFASKICSITNGVHMHTWLSGAFSDLFDRYASTLGDWRRHPGNLKKIIELKSDPQFRNDIFAAHQANKKGLVETLGRWGLKEDVLTIGWARRIAGYKRPALIFHNVEQILRIAYEVGPLQIVLAGKAHPNDDIGSAHIEEILDHIDQLNEHREVIKVLILENYDTYFGKLLTNSVDVWLNNPLPPFEASGTSGMKAILNGVVQVSTLDGWVVEAEHDDIGWIFGYRHSGSQIGQEMVLRLDEDSHELYGVLNEVAQLYYQTCREGKVDVQSPWIDKMIHCVGRSAFFNTQRMMQEYKKKMWQL
ncbi:MAG: alpha-glucan family phosphorylase [Candidatus Omnitrophica bacterium]|nr:alpha-glucan family phosphorylase [Candidatus Omnitrophota bacterium]